VSYRPWLEERALRQMGGLPPEALDVLVRALARICEDPYDRLFSRAVQEDDPGTAWLSWVTSGSWNSGWTRPPGWCVS
jgi:hypothetical protein